MAERDSRQQPPKWVDSEREAFTHPSSARLVRSADGGPESGSPASFSPSIVASGHPPFADPPTFGKDGAQPGLSEGEHGFAADFAPGGYPAREQHDYSRHRHWDTGASQSAAVSPRGGVDAGSWPASRSTPLSNPPLSTPPLSDSPMSDFQMPGFDAPTVTRSGFIAPDAGRADGGRSTMPRHEALDTAQVPLPPPAGQGIADDSVEGWALAAARGLSKAVRGVRRGWHGFATGTIALAARLDIPARIAAMRLDEKSRKAAEKAGEASKIAARRTAEASRIAALQMAHGSRIAASHMAEGSRLAAEHLGVAAGKAAELSRVAGENIAEGVARLDLPEKIAGAGDVLRKGGEQLAEVTRNGAEVVIDRTRASASEFAEKAVAPILDRGKPQLADAQTIPSELERLLAEEAAADPGPHKPGRKPPPSLPLFADIPETDKP